MQPSTTARRRLDAHDAHDDAYDTQQSPPASALARPHTEPDSDSHSDDDQDDAQDDAATQHGKRKRPTSVSCELCKQRKVKCDRGQPSCGWCARNGANCEYKERRRPGLRAGFGKELQERMDKLEAILQSHSEIIQSALASNSPLGGATSIRNSNPSLSSGHETPRDRSAILCRSSEHAAAPQAENSGLLLQRASSFAPASQPSDFGVPQHAAAPDGFPVPMSGLPAAPPMSPAHITAPGQGYYPRSSSSLPPKNGPLNQATAASAPQDQDMPPYDLLYALVDLFFKHINTWCPILHRKTTLDSLFGPSALEETDGILLRAIVTTTMRYSTDPRLTQDRRHHYHKACKERVLLYGMENTSVKSLQALVIVALDLVGSSNGPPGWNILALITRAVVQLGLAVESNSFLVSPSYASIYTLRAMILPEPKDFVEDESRRRLFWMVYVLDRYATIATAFEFSLADKEIDRTLPCRDHLWMQNQRVDTKWFKARERGHEGELAAHEVCEPGNVGPLAYYIEVLGILSKIHTFLKKPVDIGALGDVEQWQLRYKELDKRLATWRLGLPAEFGNMAKLLQQAGSKKLNCALVMLHATYHTAVIRLHSSAAYPTTRSPIFTPSYSASKRCHGAVESIAALGDFVAQNGLLPKLGPPFAWTMWVSARLLLVHGSTVEHRLSPQIGRFVETLGEMGRYWPVAARYRELLQRVLDEHRDSETKGDGVAPSSVRILADMRRTAFDLELLISRQPRQGGAATSLRRSVTPARAPAANELEYLDVFDFFNVPRLAFGGQGEGEEADAADAAAATTTEVQSGGQSPGQSPAAASEFNITNFMVDVNSDWLYDQDGGELTATG
ncbi:uncharacterized protein UV8b_04709 [Ustilaginoidea virens]|uniref:Zn(2)-C6 fungal-type domain-containing protein n=1 Tax=Ustilaginoidea virens TaxID=1159556 RepID=A0A8E5HSB4_USTVR|nr:uncharacterized protein UV8b_04709 [Ustilaginoidea virens]QUC20468.1 hypothetical protein UV8b_04709 [Ustilaginoidea virens]